MSDPAGPPVTINRRTAQYSGANREGNTRAFVLKMNTGTGKNQRREGRNEGFGASGALLVKRPNGDRLLANGEVQW